MRHSVFGRKLSRSKNERKRLFSLLIRDLVIHGKIVTSRAKAKAVQPMIEKLVTKAKKGTDFQRRNILRLVPDKDIVEKLMMDAKDRFSVRSSGFTRIVRLGVRRSDNAENVMLSFVDEPIFREPVKYEQKEIMEKKPKKQEKPTKKRVRKTAPVGKKR